MHDVFEQRRELLAALRAAVRRRPDQIGTLGGD
jgi:hypothetical protein